MARLRKQALTKAQATAKTAQPGTVMDMAGLAKLDAAIAFKEASLSKDKAALENRLKERPELQAKAAEEISKSSGTMRGLRRAFLPPAWESTFATLDQGPVVTSDANDQLIQGYRDNIAKGAKALLDMQSFRAEMADRVSEQQKGNIGRASFISSLGATPQAMNDTATNTRLIFEEVRRWNQDPRNRFSNR